MFFVSRKAFSDVSGPIMIQYASYPYSLVKLLSRTGIYIIYKTHAETSRNDVYPSKRESEKTRRTERKKQNPMRRPKERASSTNATH